MVAPVASRATIETVDATELRFTIATAVVKFVSSQISVLEQLGLKLESRSGPVDVVVVDQITSAPTGN